MRYKMMGGIEQGIHYTTFQEDVEDGNQQSLKAQEGASKSYGETKDEKLGSKQPVLSDKRTVL